VEHTRFSAQAIGTGRTGIATVIDSPKGGIIRVGGQDVGILTLDELNRIRFAESNGLRVELHIDLCEADRVYGRIIVGDPPSDSVIFRNWKVVVAIVAAAVALWGIAMMAVKIGF
jgi:hypothetical protein